jgi:hypothetical protein
MNKPAGASEARVSKPSDNISFVQKPREERKCGLRMELSDKALA